MSRATKKAMGKSHFVEIVQVIFPPIRKEIFIKMNSQLGETTAYPTGFRGPVVEIYWI